MTSLSFLSSISEEMLDYQMEWIRSNLSKLHLPTLYQFLRFFDLTIYYEDILRNTLGPLFEENCKLGNGIENWTVKDISNWMKRFEPLKAESIDIATSFEKEWINGKCFMSLSDHDFKKFGISKKNVIVLSCIRKGWLGGWGLPIQRTTILSQSLNHEPDIEDSMLYGQLIVIGTKESRLEGLQGNYVTLGRFNETFQMKKRETPNGKKYNTQLDQNDSGRDNKRDNTTIPNFILDNNKDMFQIGRSEENDMNDFIIHGGLHFDQKHGILSSPISRYACRIECDRYPPYSCHVFASGFCDSQTLFHGEDYITLCKQQQQQQDKNWNGRYDELTTFGIKLWNPRLQQWCEISVQGNCYHIRENKSRAGSLLAPPFTNQLHDGSILDLHGVLLYYQKPFHVQRRLMDNPRKYITKLNEIKPQCPVMMQTIQFEYMDSYQRQKREWNRMMNQSIGYIPIHSIHIPPTDYYDIDEHYRTYVFPACGHVHGYHPSLVGKSCPLCRQPGHFVPLAFELDSPFGNKKPTYVFNPCGHVASRRICKQFANIPMFIYDTHGNTIDLKAKCPFCASVLHNNQDIHHHGEPFHRLIVQSESGINWELESNRSGEEDDDEDEDKEDEDDDNDNGDGDGDEEIFLMNRSRNEVQIEIQTTFPIQQHVQDNHHIDTDNPENYPSSLVCILPHPI